MELVCPVPEALYQAVLEHLRATFFVEEPLNLCEGMADSPPDRARLEAVCLDTLRDGLSVVALLEGRVVGAALNGAQTREQLMHTDLRDTPEKKFRTIFSFLYGTNRALDLFSKYGVSRIFECRILSVAPEVRGRGVARQLLQRSEQHAREQGFALFKEDATGLYSQRLGLALGMRPEIEVPYAQHLGEDGRPVFEPPAPHTTLQIMTKLI